MARRRPLARPPIKEALVDFRVASDPPIEPGRLQALRNVVVADYPQVDERRSFSAEIRFDGEKLSPATRDLGFHGLFFKSEDGHRLAQFRRDGFTLNQLAAYSNADNLIREALRLWELYRDSSQPLAITRIALRYINALRLPLLRADDFSRFLTAAPTMPPSTPQALSSFLTRVVAHDDPDVVIVTQKLDPVADDRTLPFTLDIDAFRAADGLPLESAALLRILERLRELKNRIFFEFLTDEAVELYQ
jgi:uncharacterized protein (TIGR04255 family)